MFSCFGLEDETAGVPPTAGANGGHHPPGVVQPPTANRMHEMQDPLMATFESLASMLFNIKSESDMQSHHIPAALTIYRDLKRILSDQTRGEMLQAVQETAPTSTRAVPVRKDVAPPPPKKQPVKNGGSSSSDGASSSVTKKKMAASSPKEPSEPKKVTKAPALPQEPKRKSTKGPSIPPEPKRKSTKGPSMPPEPKRKSTKEPAIPQEPTRKVKKKVKKKKDESPNENSEQLQGRSSSNKRVSIVLPETEAPNTLMDGSSKRHQMSSSSSLVVAPSGGVGAEAALAFLAQSPDFLQALLETAKQYAPAEICFFASCDEGEEDYSVMDERNRTIFTSMFLRLAHKIRHSAKTQTNEQVLLELSNLLTPTGYKAHPMLTTSRSDIAQSPFRIFPSDATTANGGSRHALIIAILYQGQDRELTASHSNAKSVMRYLTDVEGMNKDDIAVLMDDGEHDFPTKEKIQEAFCQLVQNTNSGDSVFVYFSGLGGQVEDDDNEEEDGFDEVLIPFDVDQEGPIRDDDIFRDLISPMPEKVQMLCVFDAAHSGTMLELPFKFKTQSEQNGRRSVVAHQARFSRRDSANKIRAKEAEEYVPAQVFLFASCDEGEQDYDVEDDHHRSIFTSTMLDYCVDVVAGLRSYTNEKVLQELADTLGGKGYKAHPVFASSRSDAMSKNFNLFPTNGIGETRALVIGIQYTGQPNQLPASHNTASSVVDFLKEVHDLEDEQIHILMDDGNHEEPTKENILKAFQQLVMDSIPGDAVFLYFAGHGGQVEDDDGEEEDGMDEVMLPVDAAEVGPIRDDQIFSNFICRLAKGVTMHCMFDASHSGTMLELPHKFSVAKSTRRNSKGVRKSEIVNHGTRYSRRQSATRIRNAEFLENPLDFPERYAALLEKAEIYAPAEIMLFASCDDGEEAFLNENDDATVTSAMVKKIVPGCLDSSQSSSSHVHGIFTNCMLQLMKDVKLGTNNRGQLNNGDILLQLTSLFAEKGVDKGFNPILTSSRPESRNQPFCVYPDTHKGTKRALLIGILYKGQGGELKASHNNVRLVKQHLIEVEGVKEEDIIILMDKLDHDPPKKRNILAAFNKLVTECKEGDAIFTYYTGHGGQVEDCDGDEEDGFDEVLLPVDVMKVGPLKDDDIFLKLVSPMKKGVKMTCVFDSSHSGSVLELPFKFTTIGGRRKQVVTHEGRFSHMTEARALRNKEKEETDYWASIAAEGGEEAVIKHVNELSEIYAPATVRLFAACEDGTAAQEERNIDQYFSMPSVGARPGGMFTGAMIQVMKLAQEGLIETNRDALAWLRNFLEEKSFNQKPVMSSSRLFDIDSQFRIIPDGCQGTLRALLIGINYTGHGDSELQGSHTDVRQQYAFLMSQGFLPENVTILMDAKKKTKPTRRNILKALRAISLASKPGDVVFVHFSGHGGQIEDQDGDEDDGHDETLIPLDVKKEGPIRDDTIFKKLVATLPEGVTLTACFDCCNSGTILDLPFEFTPDSQPRDLIQGNLNFFPHMEYAKSLRSDVGEEDDA